MREATQQHYLTGTRFFEEGQWDASLVEFIASFQLSGERDLLFNISWTHEKAGRTREAQEYAERYLVACRGTDDGASSEARRLLEIKVRIARKQCYQHRPSGSSAGGIADDSKCTQRSNSRAQRCIDFISGGRPGEGSGAGDRSNYGRRGARAGWRWLLGGGLGDRGSGWKR